MWTQSLFRWFVIAEVAETVEDAHHADNSKQIGYDNTGSSTISEKVNNTMQTTFQMKQSEEESSMYLYYICYYNLLP